MTSKALDNVAKLRDIVNVRDFGASPTASATVNTAAIQAAIDYVYGLTGGGAVQIIGDYNINGALVIGSLVRLQGPGRLVQTTANTPIIKVTKGTFNQGWSIRQLELQYQSAQPSTNTDARAIILCEANKFSYSFIVEDVRIWQAAKGIDAPEETASFAFLGTFNNVVIEQCSDWGFDWRNAITGGSTYLSMNNVWVNNIAGQEIAGSKGFRIQRCATLCINSIAIDHIQADPVLIDACVGNIGVITVESCDRSASSGDPTCVIVSGGNVTIGEIALEANNTTISGTADAAGVKVADSGTVRLGVLRDNFNQIVDTSSGAWYTANVTSNSTLYVDRYIYGAASSNPVPNGALADFSTPVRIRQFAENVRRDVRGGKTHVFGTAPPASGTWAKGDITWNNDPIDATSPIGWICLVAGTPGTWLEFGAPIITQATAAAIAAVGNAINTTGKFGGKLVWDSTNNRLLRTQGGAAADPWYVADGSATVTPS
jgi:hypothetical protein